MIWPCRRLSESLVENPFTDRHDQAKLLGKRNELRRRNHAQERMPPAQQCLETADSLSMQSDDGLIEYFQLPPPKGFTELKFHGASGLDLSVHFNCKEAIGSAALGLCTIECHVSIFQQYIRRRISVGRKRDTDADGDNGAISIKLIRLGKCANDALGKPFHLVGLTAGKAKNSKLVAPKSCNDIRTPYREAQTLRHRFQ